MSIHLLKGSHSCSVSNSGGHSQFPLRLSPVCAGEKPLGAHGWEGELSPLGVLNNLFRGSHSLSLLEFMHHPFFVYLIVLLQFGSTVLIILHVFYSVLTNPIMCVCVRMCVCVCMFTQFLLCARHSLYNSEHTELRNGDIVPTLIE